jgi:hypothetical protein
VAKYFSEYPESSTDNLIGFQVELKNYVKEHQNPNPSEDMPKQVVSA